MLKNFADVPSSPVLTFARVALNPFHNSAIYVTSTLLNGRNPHGRREVVFIPSLISEEPLDSLLASDGSAS
jgi:hypothetical protein